MVAYVILFGDVHSVAFLYMMCMHIETFHISAITPNATMIIYGSLFGVMHPTQCVFSNLFTFAFL